MAALPPITSNALYSVEINFDGLKDFPESLTLSLPNDEEFTIGLTRFLHRSGYLFRIDEDPPGTPPVRPNPNAELSDFSYSWQGTNDEYDVLLTVNKGILIGLIAGNEKRYTIKLDQESESTYIMSDVRPEGFRPMDPHTGESEPLNYEFNPLLVGKYDGKLAWQDTSHQHNLTLTKSITDNVDFIVGGQVNIGDRPTGSNWQNPNIQSEFGKDTNTYNLKLNSYF